jgi:hypothetical protein
MHRLAASGALITIVLAAGLASSAPDIRLDVPLFRQQRNGCGAASVAMVVHYWSRQLPELGLGGAQPAEVYEQLYSAEIGGIPMAAMKRYLEERGFHAFSVQASWEDLEDHPSSKRSGPRQTGGYSWPSRVGGDWIRAAGAPGIESHYSSTERLPQLLTTSLFFQGNDFSPTGIEPAL